MRSKFLRWRMSFSENRYPLFRDMPYFQIVGNEYLIIRIIPHPK